MKERSKKKLARSTWAGCVKKMGDKKLAKRNGGDEDRNCDGGLH